MASALNGSCARRSNFISVIVGSAASNSMTRFPIIRRSQLIATAIADTGTDLTVKSPIRHRTSELSERKMGRDERLVGEKRRDATSRPDGTLVDEIAATRECHGEVDILFRKQDSRPSRGNVPHRLKKLLNDDRRETVGQLV